MATARMMEHMHSLIGHDHLQTSLARACQVGSLSSGLLIHGPPGVGKQHLGLWVAQVLLCPNRTPTGPCTACKSCSLALKVEHPDLHWFFPVARPKNVNASNLEKALETARLDSLIEKRKNSLRPISLSNETRGIYLATVKHLRKKAYKKPSMSSMQVFLIADAQAMVSRDASSEAANALLKILEEPPSDTFFLITCDRLKRLPSTIISRTVPIHLPAIPTDKVKDFLMENLQLTEENAGQAALLSRGSVGRSLAFIKNNESDNDGSLESARQKSFHLLRACLQENKTLIYQESMKLGGVSGGTLEHILDGLGDALRDLALFALGKQNKVINTDTMKFLEGACSKWKINPQSIAESYHYLDQAKELIDGNVNSQLIIINLLVKIQETLSDRSN